VTGDLDEELPAYRAAHNGIGLDASKNGGQDKKFSCYFGLWLYSCDVVPTLSAAASKCFHLCWEQLSKIISILSKFVDSNEAA